MRTTETEVSETRPGMWPTVEELRAQVDERLKAKGTTRAELLRRVNMSNTTFERILREGLSRNPRSETTKKLRRMGVLDLIPRR